MRGQDDNLDYYQVTIFCLGVYGEIVGAARIVGQSRGLVHPRHKPAPQRNVKYRCRR